MNIATIGKIAELYPIPDADNIVLAEVVCGRNGKWKGIVSKNEISEGAMVEVYLPDAVLPVCDRFAFMDRYDYRVRIAKLRKCPSECLIMPITVDGEIGDDIAAKMGVTKYEKPLPLSMQGENAGNFPAFIPKTDEPNFQVVPHLVEALRGQLWFFTEKVDGTSCTVYKWQGHFGICSRNWEKKNTEGNLYWRIARQYNLELMIPEGIAVQCEIVGPGVQKNTLGLKAIEAHAFNVWDIENRRYLPFDYYGSAFSLPTVTLLDRSLKPFDLSDDALRQLAEGVYPSGKQREGIVIRPQKEMQILGERVSFKVLNPLYEG